MLVAYWMSGKDPTFTGQLIRSYSTVYTSNWLQRNKPVRHFPKFCVLFGEILAEKSTIELYEIGWNVVCKLFKDANPYEVKVMSDVEIQLLPFEYLVFDTDLIHW